MNLKGLKLAIVSRTLLNRIKRLIRKATRKYVGDTRGAGPVLVAIAVDLVDCLIGTSLYLLV